MRRLLAFLVPLVVPLLVAPAASAVDPREVFAARVDAPVLDIAGSPNLTRFAVAVDDAPVPGLPEAPDPDSPAPPGTETTATDRELFVFNLTGLEWAEEDSTLGADAERKSTVAVSGDGGLVAAGSPFTSDVNFVLWKGDGSGDAIVQSRLGGPVNDVAIARNGRIVVAGTGSAGTSDGAAAYLYRADGSLIRIVPAPGPVAAVVASADGAWVVSAGANVSSETFGELMLLSGSAGGIAARTTLREAATGEFTTVAITPSAERIAVGTVGGKVVEYRRNGTTLASSATFPVGAVRITTLTYSGDGRFLAMGDDEGNVRLYRTGQEPPPGEPTLTHKVSRSVSGLALSEDGDYLLVGADGVEGFHISGTKPLWSIPGPGARVLGTDDGESFAVANGSLVRLFRLTHALTIAAGANETVEGPNATLLRELTPGGTTHVAVLVGNVGSAFDDVHVLVEGVSDIRATIEPSAVGLRPGDSREVRISFAPLANLPAGDYPATIRAVSERDPGANASTEMPLILRIVPTTGLDVAPVGEPITFIDDSLSGRAAVKVVNLGNERQLLRLSAKQRPDEGGPWGVSFDLVGDELDLPGGSSVSVTVRAVVPMDTANGSSNRVTVTAENDRVSRSTNVTFVYNAREAVRVEAAGIAKVVEPGRKAVFEVAVTNLGSVTTPFRVTTRILEEVGAVGWTVAADLAPFDLRRDQKRTVLVDIFAPRNADPGDRVAFLFNVSSERGTYNNLTLFGNVIAPREDDANKTKPLIEVPSPGAVAVLFSLAAVATRAGRRWPRCPR